MSVTRCTDADLMHRIANSDGVRESVGIDVDGQRDWQAWASLPPEESGVICITDGDDALAIAEFTRRPNGEPIPGIVQIHWLFGTNCRGKQALSTGRDILEWLFDNGVTTVWGSTPNHNRRAIWFNRQLCGRVLPTSDDEFTNFELRDSDLCRLH